MYRIKREMPIGEFWDWLLYLESLAKRHEPPGVEDVGVEGMAAALGVVSDGR